MACIPYLDRRIYEYHKCNSRGSILMSLMTLSKHSILVSLAIRFDSSFSSCNDEEELFLNCEENHVLHFEENDILNK